jgi:cob(I)alamin adenosyltransferase
MVMNEFNSLNDWALVNQQLRNQIRPLYNQQHRRQLFKMQDNLYNSVTELSKREIDLRRTGNSTQYLEQLEKCRQELQEVQQWLMFATLIDTKPEE